MDWLSGNWDKVGTLLIAALLTFDRFRDWMRSRDQADSNVTRELHALRDRHAEDMTRVNGEIAGMRKRLHDLADAMQVDKVRIAILETKLEQ